MTGNFKCTIKKEYDNKEYNFITFIKQGDVIFFTVSPEQKNYVLTQGVLTNICSDFDSLSEEEKQTYVMTRYTNLN